MFFSRSKPRWLSPLARNCATHSAFCAIVHLSPIFRLDLIAGAGAVGGVVRLSVSGRVVVVIHAILSAADASRYPVLRGTAYSETELR